MCLQDTFGSRRHIGRFLSLICVARNNCVFKHLNSLVLDREIILMLNYMCVGTKYFAFFAHATYINSLTYYIISVLRYLCALSLEF